MKRLSSYRSQSSISIKMESREEETDWKAVVIVVTTRDKSVSPEGKGREGEGEGRVSAESSTAQLGIHSLACSLPHCLEFETLLTPLSHKETKIVCVFIYLL